MKKPAEPCLPEQCQYACKAEAVTQFHGWRTISAPYAKDAVGAVFKRIQ